MKGEIWPVENDSAGTIEQEATSCATFRKIINFLCFPSIYKTKEDSKLLNVAQSSSKSFYSEGIAPLIVRLFLVCIHLMIYFLDCGINDVI